MFIELFHAAFCSCSHISEHLATLLHQLPYIARWDNSPICYVLI